MYELTSKPQLAMTKRKVRLVSWFPENFVQWIAATWKLIYQRLYSSLRGMTPLAEDRTDKMADFQIEKHLIYMCVRVCELGLELFI